MQLRASAPGSLMLLGEYGVLHGKHALVCAIDKRITITLSPRLDDRIEIQSALGNHITTLATLQVEKPFQFILGVVKHQLPKLKHGFDIHVESEFSDQIGFGSSAAVTVATLAAYVKFFNVRITPLELVRQARQIVRAVQGIGSGADVAASVYGGIIGYKGQGLWVEKYPDLFPLTAQYAGYKTPTTTAIKHVEQRFSNKQSLLRSILESIDECAIEGINAVRKANWSELGAVMNMQQGMMDSLGVNTPDLHQLVEGLRREPTILGAKISGAGLGDCVVGLGKVATNHVVYIPVAISLQGVACEKI